MHKFETLDFYIQGFIFQVDERQYHGEGANAKEDKKSAFREA